VEGIAAAPIATSLLFVVVFSVVVEANWVVARPGYRRGKP